MALKCMSFDLGPEVKMGEPNHLERNDSGKWEWRCSKNHLIEPDCEGPQPVRDFGAALVRRCEICEPPEEEEDLAAI